MSYIQIVPSVSTVQISKFHIVAVRAELFKSAVVSVDLFNGNTFVRNELLPLSQEEYNAWETDEYMVSLVMTKLGFSKAPEPELPEVIEVVVEPPVVEPEPTPELPVVEPTLEVVEEEKVEETPVVVE